MSTENIYGEKLRELEADNQVLLRVIDTLYQKIGDIKKVIEETEPDQRAYHLIFKINNVLKK